MFAVETAAGRHGLPKTDCAAFLVIPTLQKGQPGHTLSPAALLFWIHVWRHSLHCLCEQVARETMALVVFFWQQMWHFNLLAGLFFTLEENMLVESIVGWLLVGHFVAFRAEAVCGALWLCRSHARLNKTARQRNHNSLHGCGTASGMGF